MPEGLHKYDDTFFLAHVLTEIGHMDANLLSICSGCEGGN